MRIVLDTNVIVSAIEFGGIPRRVFARALVNAYTPVTSPVLIAELVRVLQHKFDYDDAMLERVVSELRTMAQVVVPTNTIAVLRDEPDNRVLECAVEGNCACIVTGDKALLALDTYKQIRIITVEAFHAMLTSGA